MVKKRNGWLEMDFPAQPPEHCAVPAAIRQSINLEPVACLKHTDYIVVLENEAQVSSIQPDLRMLCQLPLRGVTLTARSKRYDFVTRFFAPKLGIDEDHVTGSAFTQLIPYWSRALAKTQLWSRQISSRGEDVRYGFYGERVMIAGKAALYLRGRIVV